MNNFIIKLISTLLISFFILGVHAQNNEITIMSQLDTIECRADSVDITIDLIYNLDATNSILPLAGQNIRVHINAASMEGSSVEILEEGVFSGFVTDDFNHPNFFADHTLVGTTNNIISYNIEHLAGEGFLPNENVLSIGQVKFSLSNSYECISILPIVDSAFAQSVVLINSSQQVSLVSTPLDICIPEYCNSCVDSIYLENGVDDFSNMEILKVGARNSVEAENVISNLSNATYTANQEISMYAGFTVEQGSVFEATIEDCEMGSLVPTACNISIAANPSSIDLCTGVNANLSFEICNQNTIPLPNFSYEIIPSSGITCNSLSCLATIPTILGGTCETVVINIDSNVPPGTSGTIELVPSPQFCWLGNNQITVTSPSGISVIANQSSLELCPGYADQIQYEICNTNSNTISFAYSMISTSTNVIISQSTSTIVATPGCINLTIDVTNNMNYDDGATLKLIPAFGTCLSPTSSLNISLNTPTSCFYLDANAYLEGSYTSTNWDFQTCEVLMENKTSLPSTSPQTYNSTACTNGTSFPWLAELPATPIDWVFVELRDANDTSSSGVVCTRTALLNRDGSIFSINSPPGTTLPVAFHTMNPNAQYYVVIRHRNHLDVMTDNALSFQVNSTTSCSFSDGSQAQNHQFSVAYSPPFAGNCNGIDLWFLKSGDVNNDHLINAADRSDINNNLNLNGYSLWDCIFNDEVDSDDQDVAWKNRNSIGNVPQ